VTKRLLQLIALGVNTRCAVDLLRYFQRHPTAYVTTDQLASCVGYVFADIEGAIASLTRAGLLMQRRHRRLTAAVYRLVPGQPLSELAKAASSASGWQQVRRVLRSHELSRVASVTNGAAPAGAGRTRHRASVNWARPIGVSVEFVDPRRLCDEYERLSKVAKRQLKAAMAMRAEAKRMTVRADDMMARASAARAIVVPPRAK